MPPQTAGRSSLVTRQFSAFIPTVSELRRSADGFFVVKLKWDKAEPCTWT